jgi:uncharacterized protein YbjT (DUF2867 family)
MVIGVLGGTGAVGREVVAELARRGHAPIVLSRHAPADGAHRRVDVGAGEGVEAGVEGLDVLIEVINGKRDVLVDGLRRTLAAARAAGVGHVVSLSIVGCDRVDAGYYRTKVAQEAVVRGCGIPWSLMRATQFHGLIAGAFAAAGRVGVLPLLAAPIQPVAPQEVAAVLADRALAGPTGAVETLAGPRVERLDDLARTWAAATGGRRLPLRIPLAGGLLRAVGAGALTDPAAPRGTVPFSAWLGTAA